MTKDQLWHRLTGAPDLYSADMTYYSRCGLLPASDELRYFAKQTFAFLCTTQGLLTLVG